MCDTPPDARHKCRCRERQPCDKTEPDSGGAEPEFERGEIRDRKRDKPVGDNADDHRHTCVFEPSQRAGGGNLKSVENLK